MNIGADTDITASAGVRYVRSWQWTLLLAIAIVFLQWASHPALAATPHSYPKQCDTPGGPTCPPGAPDPSPWSYQLGVGFGATPPIFHSQGEALDWYLGWASGPGFDNCSVSYTGATEGPIPGFGTEPIFWDGLMVQDAYTLNFSVLRYKSNGCIQTISASATLLQTRSFSCPGNTSVIYQASPLIGPYCGYPGTPQQQPPDLQKQMGCPCNHGSGTSNSGGADSGSSRTIAGGNPVDASNGNEYLAEVDYAGTGSNRLKFVRAYNSLAPYAAKMVGIRPGGFYAEIAGVGWSASYFQSLSATTVTDGTTTYNAVYAFRPDGRRLIFTEYQGVYTPEGDVADSLAQTDSGWQYQTADDTIETYSADGRLLSIAARGQAPVSVNYSPGAVAGDLPLSVSDAFGHTLQFSYTTDPGGGTRLGSITDPAGKTVQYGYGGYGNGGNLTLVTYQDGTTRQYAYGTFTYSSLTGITDEANVQYVTFNYTSNLGDHVLSTQLAGGVGSYSLSYPSGSVTVTDPLGKTRTYNEQLNWGVYRTVGVSVPCLGCNEDFARVLDSNGNITSRTDFNNNQTVYSYDPATNLETSRTEAYGTANARTITTQWNPSYSVPTQITEPNRTTTFSYDDGGNLLSKTVTDTTVTPNVSRTWTYTYDGYGRMLTARGPRTDVNSTTTYTYYTCTTGYQCGQVQTVTDALGHLWSYNTYNAHGQPLTITDPNGVVTTLTYDVRQRLTSRSVASETTVFSYYPTGLLKTVILPDNSSLTYTYDGAHRLTQISDSLGNKIVYTLDGMGNRTAENTYDPSGALHRTHTRIYNALSELSQDIGAANTAAVTTNYGYDNNGNQTSIAAPLSRNTGEVYDALNRLKQITDPAGGTTGFAYDANDNLVSVTDPRTLVTSYGYNGFGDLSSQVSPDTGATTNTYDSGGNLAISIDARGVVATYAYDALNRVTSVAYSSGGTTDQTLSFTYDTGTNGKGRLTGASDANHSLAWSYDALGRVISKSQTVGAVTRSVGYTYTSGDLTTLTTPSGQTVTYGYNSNHRITSVVVNGITVLNGGTYEPMGSINGWSWGNSTTASRTYDADGDIIQVSSNSLKTLTYDNASRLSGITDTASGSSNWTYGYDVLDRLTSGGNGTVNRGWTYDANGNRLTETGSSPSTYSISPASNQITGITGTLARSYGYDAAGHTTSYSDVTARYNDAGRLQTVTRNGVTETLTYNALGQRIETAGGPAGTVLYWYDEQGHLLGEYDGSGNLIEETVWLGDIPVATLRPKTGGGVDIFYVHTDHLNTPRAVTRPSDNMLMWTWYSDPFGTDAANENPAGAGTFAYNLRFPGQVFDGQAGLHANWKRDYDPAVGRYTESDPIGLHAGVNTYAYVASDPISDVDPTGLLRRGANVTDSSWQTIAQAESKIRNELRKSCSCHQLSSGDGCIPCELIPTLTSRLDFSFVNFGATSTQECGIAGIGGWQVWLSPDAISGKGCGGCFASVLYHELLHNSGLFHDGGPNDPTALQQKCIGNLCKKGN